MAPVIQALRAQAWAEVRVLATAQHREMLDQVLGLFGIVPDLDLDIMQSGQSLAALTSRLIERIDLVLTSETPDVVVAQGDTTTVFAMALCCFYRRIPFAHVEAGLRTFDRFSPFPEEMNRHVASYLADLHFAPTEQARENLLQEGVNADRIRVTGNTVVDALLQQAARNVHKHGAAKVDRKTILVTTHRRENFGPPLESICAALLDLVGQHDDIEIFMPVHPNPNVVGTVHRMLQGVPRITLCAPMDYAAFVEALQQTYLVLTDSGGLQEEAPALGKPVLVMRTETERPEAIAAGVARMVGVRRVDIVAAVNELLADSDAYARMSGGASPYGDGHAAARIVTGLRAFLQVDGQLDVE
jgi:UDP-N-acetylglucosamine 2-epimerase (non-hydrolysing)